VGRAGDSVLAHLLLCRGARPSFLRLLLLGRGRGGLFGRCSGSGLGLHWRLFGATSSLLRSGRRSFFHLLALSFDARGLPSQVSKEEEPIAVNIAVRQHLNFLVPRTVKGEDALDSDPVRNLPDRKGGPIVALRLSDDDAFERLNPLLVAFLHLPMNAHRVSGAKLRHFLADILRLDVVEDAATHDTDLRLLMRLAGVSRASPREQVCGCPAVIALERAL